MIKPGKRYTAIVKIIEIQDEHTEPIGNGYQSKTTPKTERDVINMVIRGSELENLKLKIKAHVDLAEEL